MNLFKRINLTVITAIMALCLLMPCCYAINSDENNILTPKTKVEKQTERNHVLSLFFKSTKFVFLSILLIVVALMIYRKVCGEKNTSIYVDNIEKDLNSPETVDDAIKFVIEKF